jgi:hypothetical protein
MTKREIKLDLFRYLSGAIKKMESNLPPVDVIKIYNNVERMMYRVKRKFMRRNEKCLELQEEILRDIERFYVLDTSDFFVYKIRRDWFGRFLVEHHDVYEHIIKIGPDLEEKYPDAGKFILELSIDPESGDRSILIKIPVQPPPDEDGEMTLYVEELTANETKDHEEFIPRRRMKLDLCHDYQRRDK